MNKLSAFLVSFLLALLRHIGSLIISIILIIVGAIFSDICLYIGLFLLASNIIVALVNAIRMARIMSYPYDDDREFNEMLEHAASNPKAFIAESMETYDEKKQLHGEALLSLSDEDLWETVYFQTLDLVEEAEEPEQELDMLTGPRRIVYILNTYDAEIQNGGLCQFFVNSSGSMAPYVCDALRTVGAAEHLKLFNRFITSNHIDVTDLHTFKVSSKRGYLKQTQRYDYAAFDEAYYNLPVLQERVTVYIKDHIHEF